jgi:hypothetical protein
MELNLIEVCLEKVNLRKDSSIDAGDKSDSEILTETSMKNVILRRGSLEAISLAVTDADSDGGGSSRRRRMGRGK